MRVLIVQENGDLGRIWALFLTRMGLEVHLATASGEAIDLLAASDFDALVVNVGLEDGEMLGICDYATVRNPDISIVAVTNDSFFSGGSIFEIIPNARGMLRPPVRPDDLAAFLEHCAAKRRPERRIAAQA